MAIFWKKSSENRSLKDDKDLDSGCRLAFCFVTAGFIPILCFAIFTPEEPSWSIVISTTAVGLMTAGGSAMAGSLLGFLFGIPRTLQDERKSEHVGKIGWDYVPNTNLEQISDWLTKILVGVGLTQLTKIPELTWRLAKWVGQGLGGTNAADVMSLGILVYFSLSGFIVGYLATRLNLLRLLRKLEWSSAKDEAKYTKLRHQIDVDSAAQTLVERQLSYYALEVSQAELDEILPQASLDVKKNILAKMTIFVHDNLGPNKRQFIERTIPIFQALINKDPDAVPHYWHSQFGLALMYKENPDLAMAKNEFTKAIEIRNNVKDSGYLEYEGYRALCRIGLDEEFSNQKETDPEIKEKILKDLESASAITLRLGLTNSDRDFVQNWLTLNAIPDANQAWKVANPGREF